MREPDEIRAECATESLESEGLLVSPDLIVDVVEDLKGIDLLVLDVRGLASFTDFLVICTGSSDRHVKALVDGIKVKLRASNVTPLHTEGYDPGTWVLVDFVDFLVNVFTPATRHFYQLERVWRDAPVLVGERAKLPPDGPAATDPEGAVGGAADG